MGLDGTVSRYFQRMLLCISIGTARTPLCPVLTGLAVKLKDRDNKKKLITECEMPFDRLKNSEMKLARKEHSWYT